MKYLGSVFLILLVSCGQVKTPDRAQLIEEIKEVESQFNDMAAEKGISEAFVFFADDNATLLRGKDLIIGKSAITEQFEGQNSSNSTLTWSPDFVDVSQSGDLAYTYGKFIYTVYTEAGDTLSETGVFHTVWKRQADGSWKYVWD